MEETNTEYKCVRSCFFRGRLWGVGEILSPKVGEIIPRHFEFVKGLEVPTQDEPQKPMTFSEMNKAEDEKAKREEEAREKAATKVVRKKRGVK